MSMSSSAENLDLNMAPKKGFDLNDAPMADEEAEAEAESEEETEKEEEEEKKEANEEIEEDDTEMYIRSQGMSQYTDNVNGKDHHHHHQFGASLSFSFRKVESAEELGFKEADLDILCAVWNAYERQDLKMIDDILSGVCEDLARSPFNCNRYHYLACIYVSKKLPELFALRKTCKVILSFFSSSDFHAATKKHLLLPSLASKLLSRAFESILHWPLEFIRVYLDDAVGPRAWIENDGCKEFVVNVVTAFSDHNTPMLQGTVKNRYQCIETRRIAREEFLKAVQFLLGSSTTKENLRQLLKLLIQGVGYEEVRVLGSSMLESWLNSPIHLRAAKTLLDEILDNLHGVTENDIVTLQNLLALRVQSSQSASQMKALHGNIYTEMITRLVSRRLEYGSLALRTFVLAEITAKSLFNMRCISIVMKAMPVSSAPEHELATVLQEHALNVDTRSQLRELGRRLLKYMGQDLNLYALCLGLLQPWRSIINHTEALRESWLMQIIDLACQFLLYGVSHLTSDDSFVQLIKELERCRTKGWDACAKFSHPKETLSMLEKISCDLMAFQVEALEWCTNVLPTILPGITSVHFANIIQKFLFLENLEAYFPIGEKCGDVELTSYQFLCASTQASEDILARLIYMGISKDFPLIQAETLQIVERLVWRATASARYLTCSLKTDSTQLPMAIFKLASFDVPGEMSRPSIQLVYKELYWRSCIVVLMIAVNNVKRIGRHVWENISTVRHLMELLLTREGDFDLESLKEDPKNKGEIPELKMFNNETEMEDFITTFMQENPDVNNSGSFANKMGWRESLMPIDHFSTLRRAPLFVLNEIDKMEKLYQLSQLLRKCTDPDFFVEITTSQTLPCSWPWLRRVLVKDPALGKRLPLPWQIELLYLYEGFYPGKGMHTMDLSHLYRNLHMAVTEDFKDKSVDIEAIFDFLLHRLVSVESYLRARARRCFAGILNPSVFATPDSLGENFSWLTLLDKLQVQHHLLERLSSAICKAILLESSVDVVVAYLLFLKEHLPPSPSPHSLAVTVATLAIERRMLTKSLLQNPQGICASRRYHQNSFFHVSQSTDVGGVIVKTLMEALETGVLLSDGSVKFPSVTLVIPTFCDVSKKEVPKCIVDAAIEVLALLSMADNNRSDDYEMLLQLLFPGITCPQVEENAISMAWLEDSSGKQMPLLSENQARLFLHSRDARLIKTGFSMLGTTAKSETCASLGLSSMAVAGCIEDLKPALNVRFADEQKEPCYVTKIMNGWKKMELINLICNVSENKAPTALKFHDGLKDNTNRKTEDQRSLPDKATEEITSNIGERMGNPSVQDIIQCSIPLDAPREFVFSYLQARKYLREVNFCHEPETWLEQAEIFLTKPIENKGEIFVEPLRLKVPLYVSLGGCKAALIRSNQRNVDCASALAIKQIFHAFFDSAQMLINQILGSENTDCQYNLSHIATQTLLFIQEMDKCFCNPLQHKVEHHRIGMPSETNVQDWDNVTFENVESHVMMHMQLRCCGKQNHIVQSNTILKLMEKIFVLTKNQIELSNFIHSTSRLNENIARAGMNALYISLMKFSYPELSLQDHLIEILGDPYTSTTQLYSKSSLIPLTLQWVFNQSSWKFSIKTLHCLLGMIEDNLQIFRNAIDADHTVTSHNLLNHFLSLGGLLNFVDSILHHPYMQLESLCNRSEYSQEGIMKVTASVITPSVVKKICILVVVVSMLSIFLPSNHCLINELHRTSISKLLGIGDISQCCLKYQAMASRLLICMAGQNDGMLRITVNELWELSRKADWGLLSEPKFGKLLEGELKTSAKNLILTLYMLWPISIESALPTIDRKDILEADILFDIDKSCLEECMFKQANVCKVIIHDACTSTLCESIEENATSYRFCRIFAKQHPALFLCTMPSLGVLLKEFIPMIKLEDVAVRNKVACSLKTGITFLDGLRPYIFLRGDNKHRCQKLQSRSRANANNLLSLNDDPNSVLPVYMDFLQCLETKDVTHYGKVIARLADFLCHCVISGGKWRDFVEKYRDDVLETAAKKFSKIKKLSYVLTLLDNSENSNSIGKITLLQPTMPFEEVKAVREQLFQFSYLERVKLPLDNCWAVSRCKKRRLNQELLEMENNKSSAGLLATLSDLEQASSRLPAILSLLIDVLVELIQVTDREISEIVYNLLERSLYECPSDDNCRIIMEVLMRQLTSRNSSQSKIAANQASRFFFFFPESQEKILLELFQFAPEQLQDLLKEISDFL